MNKIITLLSIISLSLLLSNCSSLGFSFSDVKPLVEEAGKSYRTAKVVDGAVGAYDNTLAVVTGTSKGDIIINKIKGGVIEKVIKEKIDITQEILSNKSLSATQTLNINNNLQSSINDIYKAYTYELRESRILLAVYDIAVVFVILIFALLIRSVVKMWLNKNKKGKVGT